MTSGSEKQWDVFVSHASEDKDTIVRPLVETLTELGAIVWFDEFTLSPGDSLSRSIDMGLANSKYGVVVLSKQFIAKPWPEYELRGLVSREIGEDKVIIPLWYGVTRQDVLRFSPPLADKIAINADVMELSDIPIHILRVVRPDIYKAMERENILSIAVRRFPFMQQFDALVSHELKQAANLILDRAERLPRVIGKVELDDALSTEVNFILNDIALSATDLISATNIVGDHDAALALKTHNNYELLRAEATRNTETESLNIRQLINRIVQNHYRLIKMKSVVVECNVNLVINIQKKSFPIILNKLVDNALQYANTNSTVAIEAVKGEYSSMIVITNSGSPLAERDEYHIFRDGFRGDNSNTSENRGRGQGLFIAKGIAEIFGIGITYSSEVINAKTCKHKFVCTIPNEFIANG